MPYIKPEHRERLFTLVGEIISNPANSPGELNYLITSMCHVYLHNKGESYQAYNDIIGALEGSKLEIYRREVSPYEDRKILENGDV